MTITKCLDEGFVRFVGSYGDDSRIVDAARLSIAGQNVRPVSEDRQLIRYLMRHKHTTPFEMVDFTFHVKLPIFIARQWMRHRTFSYNEMSGRYSELPETCYFPQLEHVNFQAKKNKQGRSDSRVDPILGRFFIDLIKECCTSAFDIYRTLLGRKDSDTRMLSQELVDELRNNDGFAREISRIGLPLNTYTEFYVKGNLHNWFNFLSLRLDSHAQYEIRVYAEAIAEVIKETVPLAWEAYEDYVLNGLRLTSQDVEALRMIIRSFSSEEGSTTYKFDTKRELEEFDAKYLKIFGTGSSDV